MANSYAQLPKAGFIKRFAAFVYDFLLLLAIYFLIGFVAVAINGGEATPLHWSLTITLIIFPITGGFFYFWFWRHGGQTLGMQAWRLKLLADSNSVTFTTCLVRYCISILGLACAGLGFFWMLIDRKNRTWQDIASRSQIYQLPKN